MLPTTIRKPLYHEDKRKRPALWVTTINIVSKQVTKLSILLIYIIFGSNESFSNSLIIDGKIATNYQFPYQVLLKSKENSCGAVIVNKQHLISAAHCVSSIKDYNSIKVLAGAAIESRLQNLPGIQTVTIHPEYYLNWRVGPKVNDIAIIKLQSPIKFDGKILPASLPTKSMYGRSTFYSNSRFLTAGWGMIEGGGYSENLVYLDDLKLLPDHNDLFWKSPKIKRLFQVVDFSYETYMSGQYFAFKAENGKSLCHGDSGSPLIKDNVVYGIASHIIGREIFQCRDISLFFYTSLLPHLSWINSILKS